MRSYFVAVVISGAYACDGRAPPAPSFEPPSYVAYARTLDPPTAIEPAPFSTCVAAIAPGLHELEHEGVTRTFHVDLPDAPGLRPLVLAFHGWGGDPEQLERTTRIAEMGTARGFVVARPLGVHRSFDGGACCGEAAERKIDDVGFARALVATLARDACVDTSRVFATGFSNGGFLAHRLGCEAADVFSAIAAVAGPLGVERCAPTRPVSILHVHGKIDGIVPFAGDSAKKWRSVSATVADWIRMNRCTPEAAEEVYAHGSARCVRNAGCADGSEVTLCRDDRAAHTWPGGPTSTGWGGSQDLDATTTILEFFTTRTDLRRL